MLETVVALLEHDEHMGGVYPVRSVLLQWMILAFLNVVGVSPGVSSVRSTIELRDTTQRARFRVPISIPAIIGMLLSM